jgi:hypothetical protein
MNNVFSFLNSARILHVAQLAHMATGGYKAVRDLGLMYYLAYGHG